MKLAPQSGYYAAEDCDLEEFSALTFREVDLEKIPNAAGAPSNIPVYDAAGLSSQLADGHKRSALMAEWAQILDSGAGVFVLKGAQPDLAAIDAATDVYQSIIAQEKANNGTPADHFATAGSNDRIWNSLQKLCEAAPETFVRYFASPVIDAACEAWLGPNYQMTAQINLVHPGGKSQQAHRDYHLGFQTAEVSATYPAHVHHLSPLMTLQGGVAHCDMSIKSGPTKLLPFSQLYRPGYVAWRKDEFRSHFEAHCVQLPLNKGDALFFNPALFHAAGENFTQDVHRMVNLLQVSSAFGRAMESVDREKMCKAIYPALCTAWNAGKLSQGDLDAIVSATAEGYSFPTNLDTDPPVEGLAPKSQQTLLKEAIMSSEQEDVFRNLLDAQSARKLA